MFDNSKINSFEWGELYYFELGIDIGISSFRTLNINIEESFNSTRNRFEQNLNDDETLNSLDEESHASYYSQNFERIEMTINELQRQQRYSICLSMLSFFEGQLKSLSDIIEGKFNLRVKRVKGKSDLFNYWNYFKNIIELDTDKMELFFNSIEAQKEARNRIAHHGGLVDEDKVNVIKIGFGVSLKAIGSKYQIEITDKSYADYLLDNIEAFFKELLIAINTKYKKQE